MAQPHLRQLLKSPPGRIHFLDEVSVRLGSSRLLARQPVTVAKLQIQERISTEQQSGVLLYEYRV